MKKILLILTLILCFALTSCGKIQSAAEQPVAEPPVETPPAISEPEFVEPEITDPKEMTNPLWPVPVMYHLIMEEPYSKWDNLFVKPGDFDAHLAKFTEENYAFVFADEYRIYDGKSIVLTFDDGYLDNYTTMFPILQKYDAHATIFLVENLIGTDGYMTEDQIKEMSDSGLVHFGCHTKNHIEIPSLKEAAIRTNLEECKAKIESITGKPCNTFAYPGGKYDAASTAVVEEYFASAFTTKGSPSVWPTNHLIPRVYAARGDSAETLIKKVQKLSGKLTVDIR